MSVCVLVFQGTAPLASICALDVFCCCFTDQLPFDAAGLNAPAFSRPSREVDAAAAFLRRVLCLLLIHPPFFFFFDRVIFFCQRFLMFFLARVLVLCR